MKVRLELNVTENGTFLNYWDSARGNDVVCEVKNGKLMLHTYDNDELVETEISLAEFIEKVKCVS